MVLQTWSLDPSSLGTRNPIPVSLRLEVANTRAYERSVLAEVVAHSLHELSQPDRFNFSIRLLNPGRVPAKFLPYLHTEFGQHRAFEASLSARVSDFVICCRGDIVLLRGANTAIVAGEVWYLFSVDGQPVALVNEWRAISKDKDLGTAEWEEVSPVFVAAGDILTPVTYTRCRPGVVRTLVPTHLREGL